MDELDQLTVLRTELQDELERHLLPFWTRHTVDHTHGGFVGQIDQDGQIIPGAAKGSVLNARILWTFASAARILEDDQYIPLANRAHKYLCDHFWDPKHGGVYWTVDHLGKPLDKTKKIYAQAFAIYGLTEKFIATADTRALEEAIQLFRLIEAHGYDPDHGGYFEAFGEAWDWIEDQRLGEDDLNAPKSMNTQLHVLEAYTNLYRCWPSGILRKRLTMLIEIFLDVILDRDEKQMHLFFDENWRRLSNTYSYGHDIEANWLLIRAADVLDDVRLRERIGTAAVELARSTRKRGQDEDGGIFWGGDSSGPIDTDKHWWPQAEAIVGFVEAHRESGDRDFLQAAMDAWMFTKAHVIDRTNGEWFSRLRRDGVPYSDEDKVGLWKCPYHNVRACLELIAKAA